MGKFHLGFVSLFVLAAVLKGTSGTYWPCEAEEDCTAEESVCSPDVGQCVCSDFDAVFSADYAKCLKTSQFGDACEESLQCNLMPSGASCQAGVCDCLDGQTYVQGRCRTLKNLGESCDTDLDCYFGYDRQSVACRDQVCECSNGYYRRYGNICRLKSMDINDACVVDTDCDELGEDVRCLNLSCQSVNEIQTDSSSTLATTKTKTETSNTNSESPSNRAKDTPPALVNGSLDASASASVAATANDEAVPETQPLPQPQPQPESQTQPQSTKQQREIAVQTSIDSFELRPLRALKAPPTLKNAATATGSANVRRWNWNWSSSGHHRRRPSAFGYDDEDKTLSTLSNTDDDGEDKLYGSSCTDNGKACHGLPHSICSSNVCLCRQGYYSKNRKCFAELGEIAESADECEHTFDELSKRCYCQSNYFYDTNLRGCRKPIQFHLSCTSNGQCSPFGAASCHPEIPRRCTCDQYAEYDELQQMCIYKQGLGSECNTNDGCTVPNSMCSNSLCTCVDHFFEKDGACVPGIGATCATDDDCVEQENSVCEPNTSNSEEKSCQCRKGFVHFKDECLKEAEELEDECVETEQCQPLLASCVDSKCKCSAEQHFVSGRCQDKKELGEGCSRASECYVENEPGSVECRNSVCQCKFDYQTDVEKKACIRVLPNKQNSSGRPSALKIITFLLIGSAFLITSAAIKQAYY